jgi:hypothetical protein
MKKLGIFSFLALVFGTFLISCAPKTVNPYDYCGRVIKRITYHPFNYGQTGVLYLYSEYSQTEEVINVSNSDYKKFKEGDTIKCDDVGPKNQIIQTTNTLDAYKGEPVALNIIDSVTSKGVNYYYLCFRRKGTLDFINVSVTHEQFEFFQKGDTIK